MPQYSDYLQRFFDLPRPARQSRWVKIRNEMRIHTQGTCPKEVLLRRHPHEDEESFDWRIENYVAITRPVILRAIQLISRILEDSSYGLEISQELTEYLSQNRFCGTDFFLFLRGQVLLWMIEDPNARLVWLPEGEGCTDSSVPVEVKPVLVASDQIRYADEEAFIFLAETKEPASETYYLLTKNEVVKIERQAEDVGNHFFANVIYEHHLGILPVLELRGNSVTGGYYESFLASFLAFGNEAIRQFSDWQVVMATGAYPFKEIQLSPCQYAGCHHGKVGQKHCPRCDGKGFELHMGPFSAMVRPMNPSFSGEEKNNTPMLRFITPPTEIIEYSQQAWEVLLQKAEEALSLRHVYEAQSGIAKIHDKEELYTLLSHIGANIYDHLMAGSLNIIERYRNPFTPSTVAVWKPASYQLADGKAWQNTFEEQIKTGAAPHLILQSLSRWTEIQYGANPAIQRMTQFLIKHDPLIALSDAQITEWKEKSWITEAEWLFHRYAPSALYEHYDKIGSAEFAKLEDAALKEVVLKSSCCPSNYPCPEGEGF